MTTPPLPFRLAERVAAAATSLGIASAMIGAAALALHRLVRATADVDLAVAIDPHRELRALATQLAAEGLHTHLVMPDGDDPLGGLLDVWSLEDAEGEPMDLVQVVNFANPHRPRRTPATAAIRDAALLDDGPLRYVQLPDLIALKLDAGARRDLADIVDVLARNPDADLAAIRERAAPFDAGGQLETLLAEATAQWPPGALATRTPRT